MQSAILFLIFNRPDVTKEVFKSIRKAKPPRLYIASDGPRANRPTEKLLCEEVRKISTMIDWPCEVKTFYRNENLGCRIAVSTAIDWFFENEEEGIILEDDCLPDQTFYQYCEELLNKYRDDTRVMVISGDYFHGDSHKVESSYYFSHYNHCWGWASWRRAWVKYDRNMERWPELRNTNWLNNVGDGFKDFSKYWKYIFDKAYAGDIDSWAYRWTFSCWINNGLTALPTINLVKNIGYGDDATHTSGDDAWKTLQLESIDFPLICPKEVVRDVIADRLTDLNVVVTRVSFITKLVNKSRQVKKNVMIYLDRNNANKNR